MIARLLLAAFFLSCLWLEIRPNGSKHAAAKAPAQSEANLALERMLDPPAQPSERKSWIAAGSEALVTKAVVWENARRQERLQKRQASFP